MPAPALAGAGAGASLARPARVEWLALAGLALAAGVLLFWRLGAVHLWQDEANTAVLAVRLLEHGKPLGYDGANLLTIDNFGVEDAATVDQRTGDAAAAVAHVIRRGDLKADGAWIFHPWGQFVVAAASIRMFDRTTLAARLPFAVAALLAILLLYRLARASTGSVPLAWLAAALLAANAGWMLHARQARYYALSSLCLVLALTAWARWQRRGRAGAVLFVTAVWTWFHVDYGTVWPVIGALLLASVTTAPHEWRRAVAVGAACLAVVAPFVLYYELWGRSSVQLGSWSGRFTGMLYQIDRHVLAMAVLAAAVGVLWRRWPRTAGSERRLIGAALAALVALAVWAPTVAPAPFLRYVVIAAPLGALVAAWGLVRGFDRRPVLAWVGALVLAATPWISVPLGGLAPLPAPPSPVPGVRLEWSMLVRQILRPPPDPNGMVIEWLRANAAPDDEILVNYEDAPLMYYLPNRIRGGIAAFRVEDHAAGPPRFLVLRRSVGFVHWPVFLREAARYDWEPIPLGAPDLVWGNNPDPFSRLQDPATTPPLFLGRRRDRSP